MILLDTCAVIWDALDKSQLSSKALEAIENANTLSIADISLWEIAMLIKKRRIHVDTSAGGFIQLCLQSRSIKVLPITPPIAQLSTSFNEQINKDPADRLIAATAIVNNAELVTADVNLRQSPLINTIW